MFTLVSSLGGSALLVFALACAGCASGTDHENTGGAASGPGGNGGGVGSGGAGSGSGGSGSGCPKIWKTAVCMPTGGSPTDISIAVENGAAVLHAAKTPQIDCAGVLGNNTPSAQIYQDGLIGDFDATFTFEGLSFGGYLGQVAGRVATPGDADQASGSAREGSDNFKTFIDIGKDGYNTGYATADAGTFRIQRAGDQATVTVSVGEVITLTHLFTTAPLRISFGVVLPDTSTDPAATAIDVRLTDFQITGGDGTVKSDSFDCDSLIPAP